MYDKEGYFFSFLHANISSLFVHERILVQEAQEAEEESPEVPDYGPSPEQVAATSPEKPGNGEAPQEAETWKPKPSKKRQTLFALVAVAIVVIAAAAYFVYFHMIKITSLPTTVTTTVQSITVLANCTTIKAPGTYELQHNIDTRIGSGTCISIESSNVKILGNNLGIYGNGPFEPVSPFTYGISLSDVRNVSIDNLHVSKFSFGVYLSHTGNSSLYNVSIANVSVSGAYINYSDGISFTNGYVYSAGGKQGGIVIIGGRNNSVESAVVQNNAYYGMRINSTSNRFIADTFRNNGADLICNASASSALSNRFIGSRCSFNDYCGFAECTAQNLAYNIQNITLSPLIESCGSIRSSGAYRLAGNLSMLPYINPSNTFAKGLPCITIAAPGVRLECNGNAIKDSVMGIFQENSYGTIISNCSLVNDTYGIYLNNAFNTTLENTNGWKNVYAVSIYGSTLGAIENSTYHNNVYGLYMDGVTDFEFRNISAKNNSYGVAFENGSEDTFAGGSLTSNPYGDLYCSALSYNSTTNLDQNAECGVTDCNWATSCKSKTLPPLASYPISNCAVISLPGSYELQQNIIGRNSTCISVKASDVSINCNNRLIIGPGYGSAFSIKNVSNVSAENCYINGYSNGILAENATGITLKNTQITNATNAVYINRSSSDILSGVHATLYASAGFLLKNIQKSELLGNSAQHGKAGSSTGFMLENATRNIVSGNNATGNSDYGFGFEDAYNNTIMNNSAFENVAYDYRCTGSGTGIDSNNNGINNGSTKSGCAWLVELNPLIQSTCLAVSHASQVSLAQDMLYTYGGTCYSIYNTNASSADNTVINCNGHTVMATNGGVFVDDKNSTDVMVENCYIKNFDTAVESSAQQLSMLNNTVSGANTTVMLTNAKYPKIENNKIMNSRQGIYAGSSKYGTISNNRIENASDFAIELFDSSVFSIENNTATGSGLGLYLINTELSALKDNIFTNAIISGIECSGTSTNSSSLNNDLGGNECSSNSGCNWVTSPGCRA